MKKEEFLQQYILTRISHKKTIDDLLKDSIKAWEFIKDNTASVDQAHKIY